MAEIVDLAEYKKNREQQELEVIESLQKELRDLIAEMGGVHTVPVMMLNDELSILQDAGVSWFPVNSTCLDYYIDGEDEGQ